MRGLTGPAGWSRPAQSRLGTDDRGASFALVALSLVWIVGMAALVVDVGGGWLSRQTLVSASDAAALAAAQDLVDRPWDQAGACATAESYVGGNAPAAVVGGCVVTPLGADGGVVTVSVGQELDTVFAEPGPDTESVLSISSATWGPPTTVTALRPIAFCYDGSAALRQVIDNPPSGPTWVPIDFTRDDPTACGGQSGVGNFATIDFQGGTGSQEIRSWMLDGFPGLIGFDGPAPAGCDGTVTCYERPYASDEIQPELQLIRSRGSYVAFPVYDYADTDEIHLVGIIRARVYAYDLGGYPSDWRIELKVDPGLVAGTCCGPPDLLSGNKVIAICGVDPAVYAACGAST